MTLKLNFLIVPFSFRMNRLGFTLSFLFIILIGVVFSQTENRYIYVGGSFLINDNHTVRLDGAGIYDTESQKWLEGGSGDGEYILTSTLVDDALYLGGDFQSIGQMFSFQLKRISSCLAYLNISEITFTSIADQCDGPIHRIYSNNGTIYAVGAFNNLLPNDGKTTGAVAYLDENGLWKGIGSIFSQQVNTIAFWNDNIIIGFEDNDELSNLAIFKDGAWETLENGVEGGSVKDIAVIDDTLYVVGDFESANGVANTRGIASLDLDTQIWSSIALLDDDEYVNSIYVYEDEIYIVGSFKSIGTSDPNIAKYDGISWSSVASEPFPVDDAVLNTLTIDKGKIIVGGIFSSSNYNNIAMWDGKEWSNMTGGVSCSELCSASVTTITPIPHLKYQRIPSPTFSFDTFFRWKIWAYMTAGALILAAILSLTTLFLWRVCSCTSKS